MERSKCEFVKAQLRNKPGDEPCRHKALPRFRFPTASVLYCASFVTIGGCTLSVPPIALSVPSFRFPIVTVQPQAPIEMAPVAPQVVFVPQVEVNTEPPVAVAVVAPQSDPAFQQLVAPIALYPDPILAFVLPASTYPDQVLEVNRWILTNPNASQVAIDSQDWAPALKALAHYPAVLSYMAGQRDWTASLGSAFSENQAAVFAAIQELRLQAKNYGNLNSLVYLDVVTDGATISIQPAEPTAMYVPVYDPVLVYQGPFAITYGPSYVAGPWLVQGVDWDGGAIFVGDWHGGWAYGPDGWRRDRYFRGYDHRWGHDDRWGRRPFLDRARWASRPEMREHGGFRSVARAPERASRIAGQNQHAPARDPYGNRPAVASSKAPTNAAEPPAMKSDAKDHKDVRK